MKKTNHQITTILYASAYSILISISLGAFIIFQPFRFVDNEKSQVICDKNGAAFDIGPNYVYAFGQTLDDFNDKKARKLCEYNIIRDYGDLYRIPDAVNYKFKPVFAKDSSWADATVIFVTSFLAGSLVIEIIKKIARMLSRATPKNFFRPKYFLLLTLFTSLSFILFVRKPATKILCFRQFAQEVVNFRTAAFKYGVYRIPEEDKHIESLFKPVYNQCLKMEAI